MSRQASGFTLIELMIVVAIIAILAALAVPAYQDYVIRSQVSEGITLTDGGKSAVWDFMANTGRSPLDNASAGLPQPTSIIGNYVASVTVTDGQIIAQFGRSAHSSLAGSRIMMSPVTTPGSIPWHCISTTIPAKYLPTACR